jgi:hypothetical protein
MSNLTFSLDSRIPISESQSLSDPTHPRNVIKAAMVLDAQSNADTKYDPPAKRVKETFSQQTYDKTHQGNQMRILSQLILVLGIFLTAFILVKSQERVTQVVCVIVIAFLVYTLYKSEANRV